jgi:hypothetical protein
VSATTHDVTGASLALLVTYSDGQRDRQFDILINDRAIASVSLDGHHPDRFTDATYPIPPDVVLAAKRVFMVKFVATPGSRAGAVFDLRLVTAK